MVVMEIRGRYGATAVAMEIQQLLTSSSVGRQPRLLQIHGGRESTRELFPQPDHEMNLGRERDTFTLTLPP